MPDDKAVRIRIHGKVQSIGFRIFVKKNADDFNVNGFVKNEEDGSVTVEAQGDVKQLGRFVAACKHGPDMSRIDRFVVEEISPSRTFHFIIKGD